MSQAETRETAIPVIDPSVKHISVSGIRRLNAERLRDLTGALVIDGFDGEEPLAVIVSYGTFLLMQEQHSTRSGS